MGNHKKIILALLLSISAIPSNMDATLVGMRGSSMINTAFCVSALFLQTCHKFLGLIFPHREISENHNLKIMSRKVVNRIYCKKGNRAVIYRHNRVYATFKDFKWFNFLRAKEEIGILDDRKSLAGCAGCPHYNSYRRCPYSIEILKKGFTEEAGITPSESSVGPKFFDTTGPLSLTRMNKGYTDEKC